MEFNKYKELGAYHWEEYKNKTTYGLHADKVANWIDTTPILDIGAGDGLITYLLNKKGLDCVGIDDNEVAVKLAESKNSIVLRGDAYNPPFIKDTFQGVLMADVIEHFEFPDKVIEEINHILRSEGYLYITTPPAKKEGLHDKYHYREYTAKQLQEYVESFGYILVEPIENKYVRLYAKFQKL